jgi:hypothetical protein
MSRWRIASAAIGWALLAISLPVWFSVVVLLDATENPAAQEVGAEGLALGLFMVVFVGAGLMTAGAIAGACHGLGVFAAFGALRLRDRGVARIQGVVLLVLHLVGIGGFLAGVHMVREAVDAEAAVLEAGEPGE